LLLCQVLHMQACKCTMLWPSHGSLQSCCAQAASTARSTLLLLEGMTELHSRQSFTMFQAPLTSLCSPAGPSCLAQTHIDE
jgi:hypothetical protein